MKSMATNTTEHCFSLKKVSYTNMEGLCELRGMVFSLWKRLYTQGYSRCSTDYADYAAHLAYTTFYAICLMKHANYADYVEDNLHATTRDYALQARGCVSTLAVSRPS